MSAQAIEHWILSSEARTENELATRFVTANERRLRFVRDWESFLAWDGKRWVRDVGGVLAVQIARDFVEALWRAIPAGMDEEEAKPLLSFVRNANRKSTIGNIVALAKSDSRISLSVSQLNRSSHIFNVVNGSVNLETGALEQHTPERNITSLAGVEYHPDAEAPRWREALRLIFNGDIELESYVQRLMGYALHGDKSEAVMPFGIGGGCNGKSFVQDVVLAVFGEYGGRAEASLLLGDGEQHPTIIAGLYGKRFVVVGEPEAGARLREARIKSLTGEAELVARFIGEDYWTFRRECLLWCSSNHKPRVRGNDSGIWRRLRIVPFSVDLREVCEPIPGLAETIIEEEGPGVLRWLIEGYQAYRKQGLSEPRVVQAETEAYRSEEDLLGQFIVECCEQGPGHVCRVKDLQQAYIDWVGHPISKQAFGRMISDRFEKRKPNGGEYRRQTIVEGVSLKLSEEIL